MDLQEPNWGPNGLDVYERTYRRSKEDGSLENWLETVTRVVDGNLGLVDKKYHERNERNKLINLFYSQKAIPAGRHLWMSGVPGRQFLFNCHHSGWGDDITEHFRFTFDQLMQGGGVGANYSNKYVKKYPKVRHPVDVQIVCDPDHPDYYELKELGYLSDTYSSSWDGAVRIDDTREAWADALGMLMEAFWNGVDTMVFDVSLIRFKGAKIKTFGGTAAGPMPLANLLIKTASLLTQRAGEKMRSLDAMLIDHWIGECVVSGNVRRSARMSIKNWADEDIFDFINCKKDSGEHWSTNISIEIDDKFFKALKANDEHATAVYRAAVTGMLTNGEPGFYNRSLAQVGEVGEVSSTNPCGEIALEEFENCFSGDEKFLTKEYGSVSFSDVVGENVTVMSDQGWVKAEVNHFGEQGVQRVSFVPVRTQNGYWQRTRSNLKHDVVVTPDHRWKTVDGVVTDSLQVGDVIPVNASSFDANSQEYADGVRHGIVFGDGSMHYQHKNGDFNHRVRFYGDKAEEMASYFEHLTYPEKADVAEGWLRTSTNLKEFPDGRAGSDYLAGFVYGWMLADGSERPGGSVHLASGKPGAHDWLLENAASAGWVLRAARDNGVEETNLGIRKTPLMMFTLAKPSADIAWRVETVEELPEEISVYCATVPELENFTLSTGIATMNCNLGHVNLDAFYDDFEGAAEAHRLMTRYLIRATFGDVPNPRQREVLDRNRRIGVGHFGFQGWLVKQGIRYSDSHRDPYVRKTLKDFYNAVRKEARRYAFQLRVPEPIKVTTVAPTGTIAKLAGRTEGIHPVLFKYYINRVRFSTVDPNQIQQLENYEALGYDIEDDMYSANTRIVSFVAKNGLLDEVEAMGYDPDYLVEAANEISLADMLAVQAMYQEYYADNAVSFTVNVNPHPVQTESIQKQFEAGVSVFALEMAAPPEDAIQKNMDTLIHYLPSLKGTTLMVDGSRPQSPYEALSKEQYEEILARSEAFLVTVGDGIDESCMTGACPVK